MPAAPRLIATYFTLAGDLVPFAGPHPSPVDLAVRADAAARAGYVGLGLETSDIQALVERHGYSGIRRILADAGLTYLEVEALWDWFAENERRSASDANREILLRAAQELGAVHVKVVGDGHMGVWPMPLLVDSFGSLCRDAASAGTAVVLEIYPGSSIRDIPTARAIVEGAGEPNGGLLIDIWHMARGGISYDEVAALPPGLIRHVELDDADAEVIGTIFEDTIMRRRLPGEGALDVPAFLRAIRATGYDGHYGVEIVSAEQRARPVDEAARRSFDTTMAQFEAIDESGLAPTTIHPGNGSVS